MISSAINVTERTFVARLGNFYILDRSLEKQPGTSWNGQWEQWGLGKWLSEIDKSGLNLEDSDPGRSIVLYHEKNRDNCNLLRWDAYRIGCALKMCEGNNTINIFCLTNKP
ncbi:hypothetical protein Y032_0119g853 [Ancylostoma ceylanicum]|uniref:SCP domain-containing protein n=1 Tax=Ancylostoma ceylanicum TaxID=53326 RepID=A0A016TB72_9BILA|nr:hypothetical protein Y032_0119g853 [Ancylostoma ceylanicum]